ncbi:MAG: DEAD/DEAH box helicase [Actinomycetota bacterium]|nr:DEAD/DEAH box helicase [Actinomycetota bacterium]
MQPSDHAPADFAALGLRSEILETLDRLGYPEPSPIQREAIPALLSGADVLGTAATGTGKTAAFSLPIVDGIGETSGQPVPTALVLVPTRELAVQVAEAMTGYGAAFDLQVLAVFGGQPIHHQLRALKHGVHVVVATPGRASDHLRRGSLDLTTVTTVVLDEADEMLDMGFAEDIGAILDATPAERQTVMFSATLPPRVAGLAERYQRDPVRVSITHKENEASKGSIRQDGYLVDKRHKAAVLGRVLDIESPGSTIVFCKTRSDVDELTVTMNARGYRAEALHGGMDQVQRDKVMNRLRDGVAELLVATDVAARGLDVDTLTHVVNYDVPSSPESYVHRIGRVGRAGREGVAITLVDPRQRRSLANVERLTRTPLEMKPIPSVADLRRHQHERVTAEVGGAVEDGGLHDYEELLDRLTADHDLRKVALAALKLVHRAQSGDGDLEEIPAPRSRSDRNRRDDGPRRNGSTDKRARAKHDRGRGDDRNDGETGFVFVGLGKRNGLRPANLVGAIANETDLVGRSIGPIRIKDNYAVVGVPDRSVDEVVSVLRGMTVRGNRATSVRRYVD